jgi:hypothetical protein
MASTYRDLNSDREWRANTGMSEIKFHALAQSYREAFESVFMDTLPERRANSNQESVFDTYEDQLFFVLFSLKTGVTYDVLGFVFGCSQSAAKSCQERFLRILQMALARLGAMPERKFGTVEEFKAYFKDTAVLILDGTEQSIQRPKDNEAQKEHYSGKKKTYR